MRISTTAEYLRKNLAKTKVISKDCVHFYNSKNEIFGSISKFNYGKSKYSTITIFKNGMIFLYKSVKQTLHKIYVAGKNIEDDKLVTKYITTEIVENNYELKTKTTTRKIVELETPHKLMEGYPVQSQIYEINGKLKYSKPKIEEEKIEPLIKHRKNIS